MAEREDQRKAATRTTALSIPKRTAQVPADTVAKLLADATRPARPSVRNDRIYTVAIKVVMMEHGVDVNSPSKKEFRALMTEINKMYRELMAQTEVVPPKEQDIVPGPPLQ